RGRWHRHGGAATTGPIARLRVRHASDGAQRTRAASLRLSSLRVGAEAAWRELQRSGFDTVARDAEHRRAGVARTSRASSSRVDGATLRAGGSLAVVAGSVAAVASLADRSRVRYRDRRVGFAADPPGKQLPLSGIGLVRCWHLWAG